MLQSLASNPALSIARTSDWTRGGVLVLVLTSVTSNLLMLTGPIFMLQVYDRILPSRSLPSLVALSLLVGALYGFYAVIELLRTRIAGRLGRTVEERLMPGVIRAMVSDPPAARDLFADADTLRSFTSGSGPTVLLDLPWLPIYLTLIFLMHPLLGQVTMAGMVVTILLLVVHEFKARSPAAAVTTALQKRTTMMRDVRGAHEAIRAMGLQGPLSARLGTVADEVNLASTRASDRAALYGSFTRGTRLVLQSAVLAVGAFLVINGDSTAGIIISASILSSRAAAPIEQAVSQWRNFIAAREAFGRLRPLLTRSDNAERQVVLAAPSQRLHVTGASIAAPGADRPIVQGVEFELVAGDALGIIGASGSGKSSLGRALVGLWPCQVGEIRFDGQLREHYDPEVLGDASGYLPQEVSLLSGSVGENISRFQEGSSDAIQQAAGRADVHQLIANLPDGYETRVGERGVALSAGQRQRIGLARALFGEPFLVVLDEPNAHLDVPGEAALAAAILGARSRGAIVIVIAHRASALSAVNKLLLLNEGRQSLFGSKDDVLGAIAGAQATRAARRGANNAHAQ